MSLNDGRRNVSQLEKIDANYFHDSEFPPKGSSYEEQVKG